ncbi:hypothetical protein MRB53_016915 [Persea americana]|uniref:Uncharacterized protein n=1 Tax=Persea americana TaxID=3435 RepID=A0ACC2M4F9_PERAE|nr:hypothetical protein MRB53_016915 [Persea americana]
MLRSSRSAPTSHDPEPDRGPRDHSFFSSCSGGGREIQHIRSTLQRSWCNGELVVGSLQIFVFGALVYLQYLVLDSFFQRFSMVSSDFCYRVLIEE